MQHSSYSYQYLEYLSCRVGKDNDIWVHGLILALDLKTYYLVLTYYLVTYYLIDLLSCDLLSYWLIILYFSSWFKDLLSCICFSLQLKEILDIYSHILCIFWKSWCALPPTRIARQPPFEGAAHLMYNACHLSTPISSLWILTIS